MEIRLPVLIAMSVAAQVGWAFFGLLSGSLEPATVQRLRTAASDLKANSGDEGLDSVLAEIELRVEVELAKAGSI